MILWFFIFKYYFTRKADSQRLWNCLSFQVNLVNIYNDDITDGYSKMALGLIWNIVLHFCIGDLGLDFHLVFLDVTSKTIVASTGTTAHFCHVWQ